MSSGFCTDDIGILRKLRWRLSTEEGGETHPGLSHCQCPGDIRHGLQLKVFVICYFFLGIELQCHLIHISTIKKKNKKLSA